MANTRADQCLVQKGIAPSRTKAKELINNGSVEALVGGEWTVIRSASQAFDPETEFRLGETDLLKFVSRAGLKLEGALEDLALSVDGLRCLDLGQSTGGFTDCLLQRGADFVLGIDVGKDQLHEKVQSSAHVESYENCNVKDIESVEGIETHRGSIDLLVCDLSFISLKKGLPPALFLLKPKSSLILLVKPQFELGKKALNKKGIVKAEDVSADLKEDFFGWISDLGFEPQKFLESKVAGHDGNQEYILYATKEI